VKPKVRRCNAKKHRIVTLLYYVTVNHTSTRICKKAFTNLHKITNGKLDHIGRQVAAGLSAPRPHGRGRHSSRPSRCSDDLMSKVCEHINSFPAEDSHYSRVHNPCRKYLLSTLNVAKMYNLYKEWCTEKNYIPVSHRMYRTIFNTRFNLGFGSPKSDTCSVCDSLYKTDTAAHKQRASVGFAAMKKYRVLAQESDDIYYATFDMQKTLPLPKLSTSAAFYLRQLWLYNLGIHLVKKDDSRAYFQIWTEDEGQRGCEEVGSGLLAFVEAANLRGKQLIVWSDSCGGQNKNFYVLCLWQYLILQGRFESIQHKFPEPGHTFVDSDRDFARIEKEIRSHQNIYSADEYHNIMVKSQAKAQVMRLASVFVEIKKLPEILGLVNRHASAQKTFGTKQYFKDIKWICVEVFGSYKYRMSHNDTEPWKNVNILRNSVPVNVAAVQISKRLTKTCEINPTKKQT